jgi:3-oxoacyl-[acyl-carrier protein] reductase
MAGIIGGTELAGRVALVTGAGRNIGRAIALELAAAGAGVAVNVRGNRGEAEAVVHEIKSAGGDAVAVLADVTDRAAVEAMLHKTLAHFGRLDVLVNNAAIRNEASFAELDFAAWRRVLDVCLDGAFHCVKAAHAALKVSAAGAIINIGGLTGHTGAQARAHVVTAKAGLAGFTRALAHDLAPDGITANCVSPGMMATRRQSTSANGEPVHHATRTTLTGRRGQPEECAAAVRWLAGPGGRFVTGQVIHVNGGAFLGG